MTKPNTVNVATVGWILLLGILIYIPTFHFMGQVPIRHWDESLFGLRALHMYSTGDYMSNFDLYEGLMDHRNTKLPFTTWIQVLFMKIVGINVIALRLPIALIFVATIGYIFRYTHKHLSTYAIGIMFAVLLLCSPGIVREHILLTGDQDLPFICYLMIMVISYHQYLQHGKSKYLIAFGLTITAALLTKNLFAGAFLPGLFIYTILIGKLKSILTNKNVWLMILSVIMVYSGVIFYLNYQYPGFVDRMWGYELMGRYTDAKDGHKGDFSFFFTEIAFNGFKWYFWLVPISLLALLSKDINRNTSQLLICLASVFFSFLLLISFAETKLYWYVTPIIPIGAMMIAISLHHLYAHYISRQNGVIKYGLTIIGVCALFMWPYKKSIDYAMNHKTIHKEENFGKFIELLSNDNPERKSYTITSGKFGTPSMWYIQKYNIEKGYNLKYKRDNQFEDGELVMTCLPDMGALLHEKYNYEVWEEHEGCKFVKILNEK